MGGNDNTFNRLDFPMASYERVANGLLQIGVSYERIAKGFIQIGVRVANGQKVFFKLVWWSIIGYKSYENTWNFDLKD